MVEDGREAGRHPLYIYTYSSTPSCSTGAGTFRISLPNSNTSYNQYINGLMVQEGQGRRGEEIRLEGGGV